MGMNKKGYQRKYYTGYHQKEKKKKTTKNMDTGDSKSDVSKKSIGR